MKVQVAPALKNDIHGYTILIKAGEKTIGVCTRGVSETATAYFTTKKSAAMKRAEQLREDLKTQR